MASQYGSVLGIDEKLLLAMRDPAFIERFRQIRKESENNGMSQAAKDAHELMNSLRDLGRTADNMFTMVQADLQQKVGPELKRFGAWFKENSPEIAKRISDVAQVVLRMAETIMPVLGTAIEKFIEWDKATNGWTTNILLAVAVLKVLGGFQILSDWRSSPERCEVSALPLLLPRPERRWAAQLPPVEVWRRAPRSARPRWRPP